MTVSGPVIIEALDIEAIFQELADLYAELNPAYTEIRNLDSTPEAKLLQAFAYREFHIRQRLNDVFRSYLIAYASGTTLDHLSAFYDVTRLAGEMDSDLRRRVMLTIAGRSAGGPEERYKAIALGASPKVRDVELWREGKEPTIHVSVLSRDGSGAASPELLEIVKDALEAPEVRVVSDRFKVVSAVRRQVRIRLRIELSRTAPATVADEVPSVIMSAWLDSDMLGKQLTHAWLIKTVMGVEGVSNVKVVSPDDTLKTSPNEALEIAAIDVEVTEAVDD